MPPARDRILDAAESRFARQGFAATSIKSIGQAARLNPALIYYYFDDKAALYQAVLRRRLQGVGAALASGLDSAQRPDEALAQVIQAYAAFLLAHPDLPHLILREIIDHDAEHAVRELQAGTGALFRRVIALVERGQAEGVFRRDQDPARVVVSAIGQVVYAFIAQPMLQAVLPIGKARSRQWLAAFADHAATFALAALQPVPASPARPVRRRRT